MADERRYFVLCEDNCRFEAMTKEQILAAITQAVEHGEIHDVDTGFVTKIKEQNAGRELKFWVGTQAQYNAIETPATNVMYLITDPQAETEMQAQIDELREDVDAIPQSGELLWDGAASPVAAQGNITFNIKNYSLLAATVGYYESGEFLEICTLMLNPQYHLFTEALRWKGSFEYFASVMNVFIRKNVYCDLRATSEAAGGITVNVITAMSISSDAEETQKQLCVSRIYGIA